MLVRAPIRPTGALAVRGHRVFGVGRHAVRGVDVVLESRRFSARRTDGGWDIDGRRASTGTAQALDDEVEYIIGQRKRARFRDAIEDLAVFLARRLEQLDLVLHAAQERRLHKIGWLQIGREDH